MPLIDDIEFYGRAVDAGDLSRDRASELLARDSDGFFTVRAAASWIDSWQGARDRLCRIHCDLDDAIRALKNGRYPSTSKCAGGRTCGGGPARAHSA